MFLPHHVCDILHSSNGAQWVEVVAEGIERQHHATALLTSIFLAAAVILYTDASKLKPIFLLAIASHGVHFTLFEGLHLEQLRPVWTSAGGDELINAIHHGGEPLTHTVGMLGRARRSMGASHAGSEAIPKFGDMIVVTLSAICRLKPSHDRSLVELRWDGEAVRLR